MWGCNYFPGYFRMGGFLPGGVLWFFIWALILLLLIFFVTRLFSFLKNQPGRDPGRDRDRYDSLGILKARYAKGEVSREEYVRMKETLMMP